MSLKKIVVTMGDPDGIGPEIICKSLCKKKIIKNSKIFIIGWRPAFEKIPEFSKILRNKQIVFIDIHSSNLTPGNLSFLTLKTAVEMIKSNEVSALVTAPISKERIKQAGFLFPGHTEFLCSEFGVKKFAMMLFHERLRVALASIHIPIKDISNYLTKKNICEKLELMSDSLISNFKIKKPKIAVCGLNPHAGEHGLIGHEEQKIIVPALNSFKKNKKYSHVKILGPYAADSIFYKAIQGEFDAVLCQYHDQGLIPLKTTGFDRGVNMTLGLPFVRTSPDHGTAFDIAGQGIASSLSMEMAIEAAREFS